MSEKTQAKNLIKRIENLMEEKGIKGVKIPPFENTTEVRLYLKKLEYVIKEINPSDYCR